MRLVFANHFEALEEALFDDLAAATPADPFTPQHIVIPSLAVRRRLELGHASRFGICANFRFAYLAQWLWEQIGCFVPVPAVSPFAPNLLVWRLYRLLAAGPWRDSPRLAAYLGAADEVMRFELSARLATLFDHYLTYRPEWLAAWSEHREAAIGSPDAVHREDAAWQAELWRRVVAELGMNPFHPAADFFAEARRLGPGDPRPMALPAAASVFCLPTMPPLYIRLLAELSRWIEVRLYVLNPCRHYWFEIVDRKRLSYLALSGRELYHETGNPLLAAWGKETQAQIDLLLSETGDEVEVDDSRFAGNERPTVLAALQNAILDLAPLAFHALDDNDRSIEVHACHHLNRQLEVLHDQLLDLFEGDETVRPEEVLVVTPDLGAAAPLIDAVFGTASPGRRIPFCITGRPATQENTIARVLLQLLALPQSRFAASEIFQLLQEEPVARRFALDAEDRHLIQGWLRDSGIRWGLDAGHRLTCGVASSRHTFGEGLQRLFLGYALPDDGERLVGGVLPCAMGEGSETRALGRFWLLIEALRTWREALSASRTAGAWRQTLLALTETFLDPGDEEEAQMREVRAIIAGLGSEATAAGADFLLPLAVIRHALQERLPEPARGGVPSGRVTFAAMSSLRGLPYRVVCFLGLDDGAFPSAARPVEFDLMALAPQRGDLQRQADERNLFLDLLLAARDRVIICYSGRSIRDNAPLPPSVLVAELLDHLLPAIALDPSEAGLRAARGRLVVEHPLQAFSPRYFLPGGDARLFSFDTEYCEAARLLAAGPRPCPVADLDDEDEEAGGNPCGPLFLASPLPPADEPWRAVGLEQLLRFFRNPCRYLLVERLGVRLAAAEVELADDEPFVLDREGWRSVVDRLLPLLLRGEEIGQVEALAAAGHEFPDGKPGDLIRRQELMRLNEFAALVRPALADLRPEPMPFLLEFELGGEAWNVSGALSGLGPHGLVRYRADQTRTGDYLTAWLCHLALCALRPAGVPLVTRHLSLDGEFSLRPVENAREILRSLIACYREGLSRPLRFFPKSAWAFMANGGDMSKAYQCWRATSHRPFGEESDPYFRLALRGEADPLAGGPFEALARTVYGPLLDHLEESL